MDKISNKCAYSVIFNSGLLPLVDREYEDDRMKQAIIELTELKERQIKILKTIKSLAKVENEQTTL